MLYAQQTNLNYAIINQLEICYKTKLELCYTFTTQH